MNIPQVGQGIGAYQWTEDHIPLIRMGIDAGMTLIDTAEGYDNGKSETIVGKAIEGKKRGKIQISTKFSPENSSYNKVINSCNNSLKRLKTHYIDLYQIHWPSAEVPFDETLRAMEKLKKDRKIRYIGVDNILFYQLKKIYSICKSRLDFIQVEYNLFDRSIEEDILPFCKERNIKVIAYSPLDRGRLANGNAAQYLINRMAKKYTRSPSQIVLNWLINYGGVSVIPKSSDKKHLLYNATSTVFTMEEEDLNLISELCKTEVYKILPSNIQVSLNGEENRKTYQTLEEALKNELDFCPSPQQLAKKIGKSKPIKPVRIVSQDDGNTYSLVEGRIRYWAWVIARGDKPIPSIIRKK